MTTNKYRLREEEGQFVVTIENAKGKRIATQSFSDHDEAMKLRDSASDQGVKSFDDIKAAEAAEPAVQPPATPKSPLDPPYGGAWVATDPKPTPARAAVPADKQGSPAPNPPPRDRSSETGANSQPKPSSPAVAPTKGVIPAQPAQKPVKRP